MNLSSDILVSKLAFKFNLYRSIEAARTRLGLTQRDISATLAALATVPVLMVTGANDVIAPPRRAVAVATELRRCMLKLLPRCGHLPHEEAPEELLEALAPFLLEHLPRLPVASPISSVYSGGVSSGGVSSGVSGSGGSGGGSSGGGGYLSAAASGGGSGGGGGSGSEA
jgi:hypothetical protein